ncbi:hypothetical protein DNU06_03300 [Putridiphycobacter roseus]|uniref:Signal transduction histidine kinase internal region domain-containing protein n=1 Tax=Putridiphycobacter roseus TaxID=2219161 RepID=A0A2W1N5K4_9FLAO|nr:sensor histidine kinase [Putridiphycobacter roseus]PZE18870.1 hypothetical protein DNU06_03300 [Putridiphycobacter roseus]
MIFDKHNFFGLLLYLLSFNPAFSITYSSHHYSVENGLPSSEVYTVFKDSKGFIWFCTDRGVARYNGADFEIFNKKNGLLDNVVFYAMEDESGRIWFATYSGQIFYYNEGKIQPYAFNEKIKAEFGLILIESFYVDKAQTVYISRHGFGLIKIDKQGQITLKSDRTTNSIYLIENKVIKVINERIGSSTKSLTFNLKNGSKSILEIPNLVLINSNKSYWKSIIKGIHQEGALTTFSIWNKLYSFDGSKIEFLKEFDERILAINKLKGKYYIGLANGGLVVMNSQKPFQILTKYFNDYSICDIFYDRKYDGFWFSTLENGVYYISNFDHFSYTKNDGLQTNNLTSINGSDDVVLIGGLNGTLSVLNLKNNRISKVDIKSNKTAINKIIYDQYKNRFIIFKYNSFIYNQGKLTSLFDYSQPFILPYGKDSLITLFNNKEIPIKQKAFRDLHIKDLSEYGVLNNTIHYIRTTDAIQTADNRILIGSQLGIYELINRNLNKLYPENELLNSRVKKLANYDKKTILLATKGNGLVFFSDSSIYNIDAKKGLLSNDINALAVDENRDIWLGSSNGLNIIQTSGEIITITEREGLISNEINDIYVGKNKAYIATKKGLTVLDKRVIKKKLYDVPVYFKNVKLQDTTYYKLDTVISIGYNEPLIDISFIGIDLQHAKDIVYKYKLNADSKEWTYTKRSNLLFPDLASGTYSIELYASTNGINWSSKPALLKISVLFPFWETVSFKLIVGLTILICLVLLYYYLLRKVKNTEAIKRQIQSLKIEALNAQMNPHFIFNSLNSIQSFIINNDRKASNKYLSMFAQLMRKTLANSQEPTISLQKELDLIKIYLELENLRFNNQIETIIEKEPSIHATNVLIPTLLIQPLIENAIWHGIRPKNEKGKICIRIKKVEKYLFLFIEDNGIGILKSMEKSRLNHESKGTKLLTNRIELFAGFYHMQHDFKVKNATDKEGTIVEIKIPFIEK